MTTKSNRCKYSPVKVGDIFPTNEYGDCKVTNVKGNGTTGDYASIKFLDTGNSRDIRIGTLRSGAVLDTESALYNKPRRPCKYPLPSIGQIFPTNNGGDCEVISIDGNGASRSRITVKFLNGDYLTTCRLSELRRGQVRNRHKSTVYGIGYIGDGPHKASDPAYDLWYGILQRCYDISRHNSNNQKTYKQVSVCKEWHNYQNFADFYLANYVDGYHLDKDILNPDSKVYSPENCLFVPSEVNLAEATLRKLVIKDPSYSHVMEAFRLHTINRK